MVSVWGVHCNWGTDTIDFKAMEDEIEELENKADDHKTWEQEEPEAAGFPSHDLYVGALEDWHSEEPEEFDSADEEALDALRAAVKDVRQALGTGRLDGLTLYHESVIDRHIMEYIREVWSEAVELVEKTPLRIDWPTTVEEIKSEWDYVLVGDDYYYFGFAH